MQPGRQLPNAKGRKGALGDGVSGGDDQLRRAILGSLQPSQCRHPLARCAQAWPGTIIRQAIPSGEADDLQFRCKIARAICNRLHGEIVRGDPQQARAPLAALRSNTASEIGGEQRREAIRHPRHGEWRGGGQQGGKSIHQRGMSI